MPNKISNIPFDQIPHIVLSHPETNPEHWAIMIVLFRMLKDKLFVSPTSSYLVTHCRVPKRTLYRRLDELEVMGFIQRNGEGYRRRFLLGTLFNNCATVAGLKLNNSATMAQDSAKIDIGQCHGGIHNKNNNKNYINKKGIYLTENQKPENQKMDPHDQRVGIQNISQLVAAVKDKIKT